MLCPTNAALLGNLPAQIHLTASKLTGVKVSAGILPPAKFTPLIIRTTFNWSILFTTTDYRSTEVTAPAAVDHTGINYPSYTSGWANSCQTTPTTTSFETANTAVVVGPG